MRGTFASTSAESARPNPLFGFVRARRQLIKVWYLSSKLPKLNAVEGCWDQLGVKYLLVPGLSSPKDYIHEE